MKGFASTVILLFISVSVIPSTDTYVDTDIDYNNPPTAPIFLGPTRGVVGEKYHYTINSTDPDGDDIYYIVLLEPGVIYEWFGPYPSGEEVNIGHTWDERGTYYVLSQARDIHNTVSGGTILEVIIGEIIYVDDDNTEGPWNGTVEYPYQYIQDGIDNAFKYDTVFVYDGTYYENVIVNKAITLLGEDKNTTIIDGINGGSKDHVILIKKSFIRIKGFSVINGEQNGYTRGIEIRGYTLMNINISDCIIRDNGGGICFYDVYASNCSITNCIIYNNTRASISFYPIYEFCFSKNILIDNCDIYNNGRVGSGGWITAGGIFIWSEKASHSDIQISNCNIYNNIGDGIKMLPSDNISIYNDNIYGNSWRGIYLFEARNVDIQYNNISENIKGGIGLFSYPNPSWNISIIQNTISNNGDGGKYDGGIYLQDCSNCSIITNNTISFNHPYGVFLHRSSGNILYHNNFMNNTKNGYNKQCSNTWNNSNGEGNYWDDYTGEDNNGDGIGDIQYNIGVGYNYDYYPLMFQYGEETGVKIVSPEEGFLYIRNLKILPFFKTLILGKIVINVNAANYIYGIDRVEFYIDNKLHETDMIPPFNWAWKWTPKLILKHRHTVMVIAYDYAENNVSKELFVCRFF